MGCGSMNDIFEFRPPVNQARTRPWEPEAGSQDALRNLHAGSTPI